MKHFTTKTGLLVLFELFLIILTSDAQRARPRAIRWNIPGIPPPGLTSLQVCGQPKLDLPEVNKDKGATYWFADRPFSPGQSFVDSTDPKKLAASLLGHIVSMNLNGEYSESPVPCATDISSPFSINDVEKSTEYGVNGYKFTIKQSKTKNLNTGANVEADMKKLIGDVQVTQWLIDSLRTELTTGYSRLNNIDVKITGTYDVYWLSSEVILKLGKPEQGYYQDCQAYWSGRKKDGFNEGIITSIGFVIYNVEYSQTIADSLAFKVDALLSRSGLNVGAKFVIDNRIKTNIDASIDRGYQVLVWRKVPLDAFKR